MKRKLQLFTIAMCCLTLNGFAQNNPVENLTWSHWYEFPRNFFELNWEEPVQPHDELIGYNIYRNNQLYRFQTERTVYHYWTPLFGIVTNCDGESFFIQDSPEGTMNIHVTAVYQGDLESGFTQTIENVGLLLSTQNFNSQKSVLYPNPTTGLLNISLENLEKIVVYDISGKAIKEFAAAPQIELSDLSKGFYIVRLFSNQEVLTTKITIK